MRYRFLFLPSLLSLSACTFQVGVLTPEPSINSELSTATPPAFEGFTSTPYAPESGLLTVTPPPYLTFTFTPTISTSPIPQSVGPYPIKFDPYETYVDVVDTILAGTSKTYSIDALQGQLMSISIHQSDAGTWTVVPIKIVGADGATVCPQLENRECNFWRGVLPASQDYFVTLTPYIDILDFIMRVAINPPGASTQSFKYRSKNNHVSFSYLDDFAPMRYPDYRVYKIEPEYALSYVDTQAFAGTNLVEAYFLFGSSNNIDIAGSCLQVSPQVPNEQLVDNVNVNGMQFVRSQGGGAATGSFYEQIISRAINNGTCYEITFMIHSFNTGALAPPNKVTEFDRAALLQRFEAILTTLIIK